MSARKAAPSLGVTRVIVTNALKYHRKADHFVYTIRKRVGLLSGSKITRRLAFAREHLKGYIWKGARSRAQTVVTCRLL